MLLLFLWADFGAVPHASAQDDREVSKSHYSKASRLYEVGDYRQALDEFKAAHLAKPDPAFLYNIAQCHRQLGDLEQAVTLYKRYLTASPNAANRAEVEKRVAEIEADLAARKNKGAAATQPPPAPVQAPAIPGTVTTPASSPPVYSAPPLGPPAPAPVTGSPGVAVQPVAVATAAQPKPPGSSLRTLRWVGLGVTAALVGGAIATGVSASSKYDDLKNTCGNTAAGCSSSQTDSVKSRALMTNILWGLAGTAAVGTGVIFILTPHESTVQVALRF